MRILGYIIIFAVLLGFMKPSKEYLLLSSKKFTVEGSTSIGSFTCKYDFQTQDTLFLSSKKGLSQGVLVKEFGCGNFLLNHDFRKTLKAKEYPEVLIHLSEVRKHGENYLYTLRLDLAGKKKIFQNLVLSKEGKNLTGNLELKFADFDLHPPKKLGGAIKIEEEIKLSIIFTTQYYVSRN